MFLQCSFYSCTLKTNTSVQVFIPSATVEDSLASGYTPYTDAKKYPVLYLLHGAFDDNTTWRDNTNICRYAQARGLAVILPSVGNSFYQNMAHGPAIADFIGEELPRMAEQYFPIARGPENTFIAGNSMGGYGAFYTAFTHPGRYGAAASLSGALEIDHALSGEYGGFIPVRAEDVFANPQNLSGSGADLFALYQKGKDAGAPFPPLYMTCGTEDFLIEANRRARDRFSGMGAKLCYTEAPGVHGWKYWESHICEVLDWLPLQPAAK
jgi:putative tributyrin esterase